MPETYLSDADKLRLWEEYRNNPFGQADPEAWENYHIAYRLERNQHRAALRLEASPATESLANGQLTGSWHERGATNVSGRILSVDYAPELDELIVATAGGNIWRGSYENPEWRCLNDRFRINDLKAVRIVPLAPDYYRIFAVTASKYLYFTDDFGTTWNTALGLDDIQQIKSATFLDVPTEAPVLVAKEPKPGDKSVEGLGIYRSNSMGDSLHRIHWIDTALTNGLFGSTQVAAAYGGVAGAWLVSGSTLYHVPRFQKRVRRMGQLPKATTNATRFTAVAHEEGLALHVMLESVLYTSTDTGKTWTERAQVTQSPFGWYSFSTTRNHPDMVFFAGSKLWRYTTSDAEWVLYQQRTECSSLEDYATCLHADFPFIGSMERQGQEIMLFGTDGGLYTSTDYGETVHNLSRPGMRNSQYYGVLTNQQNPNVIMAGSQDQGMQRATDAEAILNANLDFEQVICCDIGHLSSGDGGQSMWSAFTWTPRIHYWNSIASNAQPTAVTYTRYDTKFFLAPVTANPWNPEEALLVGADTDEDGELAASHIIELRYEGGTTIGQTKLTDYDFFATAGKKLTYAVQSPVNANKRYAITENGHFFYTTSATTDWHHCPTQGPSADRLTGSFIYPSKLDPDRVYISGANNNWRSAKAVYVSNDGGQTIQPMVNGLPNTMVYNLAPTEDEAYIFAATLLGPYVYVAADDQWYDMLGHGGPDQNYRWVEYLPASKTVRFATYGRGIWDFAIEQLAEKPVS